LTLVIEMTENCVPDPVWPPPQRANLFRNVIALGLLLGAVEGAVVGAIWGMRVDDLDYGCLGGLFVGAIYGGLTGWAFSHVRHGSNARFGLRLLPIMCWLVGGCIICLSAIALAEIGDTHEFWSPPLAVIGLPLCGVFMALAVEFVRYETRCEAGSNQCTESKEDVPDARLKHVFQGSGNCAIACIATVTGMSYDEVFAASRTRWLSQGEMLFLLEELTGVRWESVYLNIVPRRLDDFAFPDWPVLVLIRPPWRLFAIHCIVVSGDVVHDPGWPQPSYLDRYCYKGWRALWAFQPAHQGSMG
jgi:uncharacterized membrane protein